MTALHTFDTFALLLETELNVATVSLCSYSNTTLVAIIGSGKVDLFKKT